MIEDKMLTMQLPKSQNIKEIQKINASGHNDSFGNSNAFNCKNSDSLLKQSNESSYHFG